MEPRTIAEIVTLLIVISTFTYYGVSTQEPNYYCLEKQMKAYCFSLSPTMKSCYTLPIKQGAKICYEGWQKIPSLFDSQIKNRYICDNEKCE